MSAVPKEAQKWAWLWMVVHTWHWPDVLGLLSQVETSQEQAMKRATLWLLTNPSHIAAAVYGMVTAILIRVM